MPKNAKTVIIGLDGVPFDLLNDLAESEVMPNTASLISNGTFKKMQSSIPEVSSVAWSSIITGRNPAEHGIYGFMDLYPNSYKMRFPNYSDLKAIPFWDQCQGKSVIINVPSTYPVREMNGVHISGFVSIDLQKSVYPSSLIPKLKGLNYRLDVDSQKAHQSMDDFLTDLDKTLDARIGTYQYIWDNEDWQIFMLIFTGTDRLMHFLWEAYEDKNHKYYDAFLNHFRKIDKAIGEISERLCEDDSLLILSDHGFERLDKEIYINFILQKEGFLKFSSSQERSLISIDYSTKAFALDPARIYINEKGKYPQGSVDKKDSQSVVKDLEALFTSLEVDNNRVIRGVYRKEDIFSGPLLDEAPDLVLVGASHFDLKASVKATQVSDKGIFSGKHVQDTAFLLVKDNCYENAFPERPHVCDIRKMIENIV
ncbi:MAG: alkaline phosphatase family protein [Planctomycetota bacterium]|jgi:predicted AlkP superfamily phosphohydrolase/phosphomutase